MAEPDTDLRALLALATDRIAPPSLVLEALVAARRHRARRTAAATAVAVVLVVVAVLGAAGLVGDRASDRGPATSGPTTPMSTAPLPQPSPTSKDRRLPAPLLDPGILQPRWDPRRVDRLAAAAAGVAPGLPDLAREPTSSPALTDDPIGIAVAVVPAQDGADAALLGTSGEWRSLPLLGRYSQVALSPRGTRLLVIAEDGRVEVVELDTGTRRLLPVPAGFVPLDFARSAWVDESRILLDGAGGGFLLDADDGSSLEVAYPTESRWAVDEEGAVVEATGPQRSASFTDWAGGVGRNVDDPVSGGLSSWTVSSTQVAGTGLRLTAADNVGGSVTAGFTVVVAGRRTGAPTAALPVLDHQGVYSGGGLGVLGVRGDGVVLLRVTAGSSDGGERVVAWDPATGGLTLVTRLETGDSQARFAHGLLTSEDP